MFEDLDAPQIKRSPRLIVILTVLLTLLALIFIFNVFDTMVLHAQNERSIQDIEIKQQMGRNERRELRNRLIQLESRMDRLEQTQ
jgi:Tfp pilus assembly protein PilO